MIMLGRSALCGGGRCGGGEVSSALTDAAFASLETLKDECAALAAEVADAARQSGKNIQAELWSGLPPDAAISSAIDGVTEALATSCDGISTAMHLDTDTAQVQGVE